MTVVVIEQVQCQEQGAEAEKKDLTSFSFHPPKSSPRIPEVYSTDKLTYTHKI